MAAPALGQLGALEAGGRRAGPDVVVGPRAGGRAEHLPPVLLDVQGAARRAGGGVQHAEGPLDDRALLERLRHRGGQGRERLELAVAPVRLVQQRALARHRVLALQQQPGLAPEGEDEREGERAAPEQPAAAAELVRGQQRARDDRERGHGAERGDQALQQPAPDAGLRDGRHRLQVGQPALRGRGEGDSGDRPQAGDPGRGDRQRARRVGRHQRVAARRRHAAEQQQGQRGLAGAAR